MTPLRKWLRRGTLVVAALLIIDAFVIEPRWPEVTHTTLHALSSAAPIAKPLRVMHLTDLHGSTLGSIERSVLRAVEEEKPDVIILTVDTSDRGSFAEYQPFLAQLHAPLGVFAVQGNWEHWKPAADEAATYEAAKITLLVNDARQLRDDVWIVGFDDALAGSPDVKRAMRAIPPRTLIIALMHSPVGIDELTTTPPVIAFAGHTHGGQVRAPLLGPLWLPQGSGHYVAGKYTVGSSSLYVSRGVGTSILPVRFACRPEIAIIDLLQ